MEILADVLMQLGRDIFIVPVRAVYSLVISVCQQGVGKVGRKGGVQDACVPRKSWNVLAGT